MSGDFATLARADWVVLVVYLLAIVTFGLWMGRGNRRVDDFFLAGREMRWWAAGLSVMATQVSAITFVGTTGQAYTKGMSFLAFYFGLPFAMVVLSLTLVPFFYRSGVFTAYQYLERRFDPRTRTLASLLFLLSRGLGVGVALYAPSLVLSVVLGWSETATILLMGGTTIAYVAYGGNRSVIWTDVVQMALIWFGIFLCVGVAINRLPEGFMLRDALALAQTTGRLETVDLSFDLTRPYTVWSGLIAGMFLAMGYFGCDQSQVQRYLSGRSLTESRLSLLFNAFLKVPMQFLILLTGVLVFVFFHFHTPPLLWNRAELVRVEGAAPAAELERVRSDFEAAHRDRSAAATAFASARREGGDIVGAREDYLEAGRRVDAAEAGARRLAETVTGEPYNDTNYIFPSLHRLAARGWAGRPRHRRHLRGGNVLAFRRVQLPGHRDPRRLLSSLREDECERPALPRGLASVHRGVGGLRLLRGPRNRAPGLRHRGGEQVRVVLLRLDPGRLRAGGPDAVGDGAGGFLRPARGHDGGLPGFAVHEHRLPLVQRGGGNRPSSWSVS